MNTPMTINGYLSGDGKSPFAAHADHTHAGGPEGTYAPKEHQHKAADITDLGDNYAAKEHEHKAADVTDLGDSYAAKTHQHKVTDVTDIGNSYAAKKHEHKAEDVTDLGTKYAPKEHNHDEKYEAANEALLKAVKKTISVEDWSEGTSATVTMGEGQTYVGFTVLPASQDAATTAGLKVTAASGTSVTFGCTSTPESPLDVYVMYL